MRQRASICKDCWFWKEMSCALASPTDGVCANKRPVQGRAAGGRPIAVVQAALTPLATGHAVEASVPAVTAPDEHGVAEPFATDAPESTFSMAQLREQPVSMRAPRRAAPAVPVRPTPPSFREIRAGRAAAAGRAPEAELRIPVSELEGATLFSDATSHAPAATAALLPCMDSLVERVRQRTAARLSRTTLQSGS